MMIKAPGTPLEISVRIVSSPPLRFRIIVSGSCMAFCEAIRFFRKASSRVSVLPIQSVMEISATRIEYRQFLSRLSGSSTKIQLASTYKAVIPAVMTIMRHGLSNISGGSTQSVVIKNRQPSSGSTPIFRMMENAIRIPTITYILSVACV